jgi:signal transduction histidine kinase
MKRLILQPSLRGKIIFAYAAIACLALVISLLAYEQLRLLENRILLGERVAELFDTALEIRRFERNLFLYGQDVDYWENASHIEKMNRLLDRDQADFNVLSVGPRITRLREELQDYQQLIRAYFAAGRDVRLRAQLEPQVRVSGQAIVATSEAVVAAEHKTVRTALSSLRAMLFFSVSGVILLLVAVGQALSRRVVQPLKQIEENVNAIASGRLRELAISGNDREIVSVTNAFNQMLHEQELRQKHMLRSEKLVAMGTMVEGVAHELNNPLSNIWSSCQILLEDPALAGLTPQRELLQQIDEQSVRARYIVRSLHDFTHDSQFHKVRVLLEELVRQTLRFIKGEIPPGLEVVIDVSAELVVAADRQRLQQALLNLFKNALQACGDNGRVTIRAMHRPAGDPSLDQPGLEACRGQPVVEIQVSDTGSGIPADIQQRIFDPFFSTKEVGKGMGLGLFIVYQVIEEHGGCISVSSDPGQGTTFVIRLPAAVQTLTGE